MTYKTCRMLSYVVRYTNITVEQKIQTQEHLHVQDAYILGKHFQIILETSLEQRVGSAKKYVKELFITREKELFLLNDNLLLSIN